ncbi:MAG: MBOAT family O-acyltransferase [Acidimicrobiales bacterium]
MSLLDVAFYLSFFPQLVAGPIVRATDMAEQIVAPPDPRRIPAVEAIWLIAGGMFKKVVVSSYLSAQIVDPVFAVPSQYSRWEVLFAIYAYAVQIFADFSGYTDIAIGCALLLGFRFPQNFDSPYRALSIQDFWRRWHITLSSWLRDYLYIPLGGNRGGTLLTYRNLWLTMVLGGLWHGAAWNFVLWGAIHGTALAVERLLSAAWRPIGFPTPIVTMAKWSVTFHIVCFAWIFFRASDATLAFEMVGRIVGGGASSTSLVTVLLVAVIAVMVASQLMPPRLGDQTQRQFGTMPVYVQGLSLALLLTAIDVFGPEGVAPFIYFQF